MPFKKFTYLLLLTVLLAGKDAFAQTCTTLGQNPSTAFPVCGTNTFSQSIVPNCGGRTVPAAERCSADQGLLQDLNPFWYKFTCFASGTLGFLIEPEIITDDYDWQLFDVTGRDPDDVYSDASLIVASNWSGNTGNTGASGTSNGVNNCAGPAYPTFSAMPAILEGHQYLLLISHFNLYSPGDKGYNLLFAGGTANITDPVEPDLSRATSSCDGSEIRLKLNKKMKCASVATDGSDFKVNIPGVNVKSAFAVGCSESFDFDSLVVTLYQPLTAGVYKLAVQVGADANTILDNCDRGLLAGDEISFEVFKIAPIPIGDLTPVQCAPGQLQFTFLKNIRCSSIAANGSDFVITGPHPVQIASAEGECINGLSRLINVKLAAPIVLDGTYTIALRKGTDGNTAIDECGEEVLEGDQSFTVKDTVSAGFTYNVVENCGSDVLSLFNNGGASITSWSWLFDNTFTSNLQNPVRTYTTFGSTTVKLTVTNGFCTDSSEQVIALPQDELDARFSGPSVYCPNEIAVFKDTSVGNVIAWSWNFGNGRVSNLRVPPAQTYYTTQREVLVPVQLIVQSNRNCYDTAVQYVKVAGNCHIAVPTAFTPNADGKNDYLYPLNAYKATNLTFSVYNKYGQRIFLTRDWTHKWDGSYNGQAQPTGTYVWMLQYKDANGADVFYKGTTVLIR